MKNVILPILLFLTLALNLDAKQEDYIVTPSGKKISANQVLASGSSGTQFIIALPSNEVDFISDGYIHIYITSQFSTVVQFVQNDSGGGTGKSLTIKPYAITTIAKTFKNEINQVYEFEKPINKTFTLTSKKNFSVYVIDIKGATSDGYLAIPTSGWGKKYMHLCYYDNPESIGAQGFGRGSGFVVLAKSNNTHVKIVLVDQANKPYYGLGRTIGGKKGGDTINVVLQANQAYAIQGDGAGAVLSGGGIGYLDLSGSEITSDSLIGLISYHNRTDIPVNLGSSRNFLVEMIPPVSAWGKKIATVEYQRCCDKGDLIRVLASENDTRLSVRWYDKYSKVMISQANVIIQKGDIWEYLDLEQEGVGVRGTCVIEANKPILANQYSYSESWDGDDEWDPFMITLTPVNQFVYSTVFQTPIGFETNYFNFIVKGYLPEDTLDEKFINPATQKPYTPNEINNMKLTSLYFGSSYVTLNRVNAMKSNRIPSTGGFQTSNGDSIGGLYWGTLTTRAGVYIMESEDNMTSFGGYIYGFAAEDGYGWPAAVTFTKVGTVDIDNPKLASKEKIGCYTWHYEYTDSTNYPINDSTTQEDLGISSVFLMPYDNPIDSLPWTYNFTFVDSTSDTLTELSVNAPTCDFTLQVIDKTKPARALIKVFDGRYNFAMDTVYYTPEADELKADTLIDFGSVNINTVPISSPFRLNNTSKDTLYLYSTSLASDLLMRPVASAFKIKDGAPPAIILYPGNYYYLNVVFNPSAVDTKYYDTLVIAMKCDTIRIPIRGMAIAPRINVEPDIDWGIVKLEDLSTPLCDSIIIYNRGSDYLTVSSYKGLDDTANYSLTTVADPSASLLPFSIYKMDGSPIIFPFQIAPKESLIVKVCFQNALASSFLKYIVFISDAYKGDNYPNDEVSQLKANTEDFHPFCDSLNFGERRLGSRNKGIISIKNSGKTPVKLLYIKSPNGKKYNKINANNGKLSLGGDYEVMSDIQDILVDSQLVNNKYFASSEYADFSHNISLDIDYTPTREGFSADTLIFYLVRTNLDSLGVIDPARNILPYTYTSIIKGSAYLPKAVITQAQNFGKPLKIDSAYSDTLSVSISDTSSSRHLILQSLEYIYDDSNYKSIDLAKKPLAPTRIEIRQSISSRVAFIAKDNGDKTLSNYHRFLKINATLDSRDGSLLPWFCVTNNATGEGEWRKDSLSSEITSPLNSDTMTTISTNISGTVYDYSHTINTDDSVKFNFTNVSACESANGEFKVYNTSQWYGDSTGEGSTDIQLSDLLKYQDSANFTIKNYSDLPLMLSRDENKTFYVKFVPLANIEKSYSSPIKVINDALSGKDSLECWNSAYETRATMALNMGDSISTIQPKLLSQSPGATIPIGVVFTDNSNIGAISKVKRIALNLEYDFRAMKYANKVITGGSANLWNWTGDESMKAGSDTLAILRLIGSGDSAISKSGALVIPYFDLLLRGGNKEFAVNIDSSSIDFDSAENCIEFGTEGGIIVIDACVIDLRGILIGGKYYLTASNPNPVTGAYFKVNYSVSYQAPVLIELYNSIGELVKTIVSETQNGGEYSREVATSEINSGVYYIKMHSGIFSETQKIIILK